MRPLSLVALATAALVLASCAPVVAGGRPVEVLSGLQDTAQLRNIYMSSDWLRAEDDFTDTFADEVGEELRRCMWGTAPIDVRIHLMDSGPTPAKPSKKSARKRDDSGLGGMT